MTTMKNSWKTRNGITIQISNSHDDLFIINYPDGGFATVHSTVDQMLAKYPENGTTKK